MIVMCTQFRVTLFGVLVFGVYFLYMLYNLPGSSYIPLSLHEIDIVLTNPYLVNTSRCKIQNVDPYNFEVLKYFHRKDYYPCTDKTLLTYIEKKNNVATLKINKTAIPEYSYFEIKCCYKIVTRRHNAKDPDGDISVSSCIQFYDEVIPQGDIVKVICRNTWRRIYWNTHVIITKTDKIQKKISEFKPKSKPLSLLFIGIDSISRINLIRMMPRTRKYLVQNEWVEMKGYNKMGDNTFPNLMAVFSGQNESYSFKICQPRNVNGMNKCPLLWFDFRNFGYITAYAEDEASINTFNYLKKGFSEPPTDYYFRPYFIASEQLDIEWVDGSRYCTGPESSGERVFNIALDFSKTFKENPFFGVFWTNTFSHNDIATPSMMDAKVFNLLEALETNGILETAMIVFISDHGLRFGEIRYTRTGWYEERLPFLYFWLPKWFRKKHPTAYQNLQNNANHFTTPYDVFMTLQDVLVYSGLNHTVRPSSACANCASLFNEVKEARNCEDANIELHWCTCENYVYIDSETSFVVQAANFVINEINKILIEKKFQSKCHEFKLKNIISSSISRTRSKFYTLNDYLLLVFRTSPTAVFEATVSVEEGDYTYDYKFQLKGSISRLDSYGDTSGCVKDSKMYCFCKSIFG